MEERAVVGDGSGRGAGGALFLLDDAVQLGSGVARIAAVLVLLDQAALNALPRAAQILKVQLWPSTKEGNACDVQEEPY